MPTYEYRCPECKHDFEKFQRMSDEPGAECPKCGASAERRLSGGAGFLFKGSGFYITDYRSDSYRKAAGSEGGGSDSSKADPGSGDANAVKPAKSSGESGSGTEGSKSPSKAE